MIVVITGAPGAGKGTQAGMLVERCGFKHLSTGDALRKHVSEKTEVGKVASQFMSEGKLVPDEVLFEILKAELGQDHNEKILLDGYPRNVDQAETLQRLQQVHPIVAAVHLDVEREELVKRLSGRRVCKECGKSYHVNFDPPPADGHCESCGSLEIIQRNDDNPEKISVRLDVYDKETAPVLDFFRRQKVYKRVAGEGELEAVFGAVKQAIGEFC